MVYRMGADAKAEAESQAMPDLQVSAAVAAYASMLLDCLHNMRARDGGLQVDGGRCGRMEHRQRADRPCGWGSEHHF